MSIVFVTVGHTEDCQLVTKAKLRLAIASVAKRENVPPTTDTLKNCLP